MPSDSNHWLWRLSAGDWIEAGTREVELGRQNLRVRRRAIVHARRGAGMALNGVLVHLANTGTHTREDATTRWGRSYVDHLRVLAHASENPAQRAPFDRDICELCRELTGIPTMPPQQLVQLSASPHAAAGRSLDLADAIILACRTATG